MIAGPRRSFDNPGLPAVDLPVAGDLEVERVRHFVQRRALALPFPFPIRDAPGALGRRLFLAPGDAIRELLLLIALLFARQGVVILADQPAVGRAFQERDVV